ncbi:hypothetical protein [Campylobacter jejuni]
MILLFQVQKNTLGVSEYYTNIDMAETIKQYYNQFNQIVNIF